MKAQQLGGKYRVRLRAREAMASAPPAAAAGWPPGTISTQKASVPLQIQLVFVVDENYITGDVSL